MKHMLEKLSGKSEDQDADAHAAAKMQVLHELRNMAMGMMGDKVKDRMPHEMHGVEVMAPDKNGLEKGLDFARKMTNAGPVGPPDSLDGEKDHGYGETLDSKLPHMESNHSDMDAAAGESAGRIALGRHEPAGDQGEPDQATPNEEYSELSDDDDDMSHDEIDSMIEELQAKKAAKSKQY